MVEVDIATLVHIWIEMNLKWLEKIIYDLAGFSKHFISMFIALLEPVVFTEDL